MYAGSKYATLITTHYNKYKIFWIYWIAQFNYNAAIAEEY